MRPLAIVLALWVSLSARATNIEINYEDAEGVGATDPTPVQPARGNPGRTLGEQRDNVLAYVSRLVERMVWAPNDRPWEAKVSWTDVQGTSDDAIATGGGYITRVPEALDSDPNRPWVPWALATANPPHDSLQRLSAKFDLRFDVNYDFDLWIGDPSEAEGVSLVATALHEYIHALGFSSQVPDPPWDGPSSYDLRLRLAGSDLSPAEMTQAQREALLVAGDDARFEGRSTSAAAGRLLTAGQDRGQVFLHAPPEPDPLSNLSHLSHTVEPDSIMAPSIVNTDELGIVAHMLSDLGYGPVIDSMVEATTTPDTVTVTVTAEASAADLLLIITEPSGATLTVTAFLLTACGGGGGGSSSGSPAPAPPPAFTC